MRILGLNYGDHDPSVALIEDGCVRAVVEHERTCRLKRAKFQVPTESVLECLRASEVSGDDIDAIAIGWSKEFVDELGRRDRRYLLQNVLPGEFSQRGFLPPVQYVRHHLSHAASAFYCSGYETAAVLVVDGEGDDEAISLWLGSSDGSLREIASFPPQHSLGHFYKSATKFSGLEHDGGNHEGKLMGLAAYGCPTEPMPIMPESLEFGQDIDVSEGPRLRERMRDSLHEFWREHCFPFAAGDGREIMAYANFASSVQHALEESLVHLARRLRTETACPSLVVAGGVGQNCAANGALARSGLFERVYVQPACHDAGVSIGAALYVYHSGSSGQAVARKISEMPHAYFGIKYSASACTSALESAGLSFSSHSEEDLARSVASLLAQGRIVGWFKGRAEVGPRALGARSILGDPRRRSNLVRVNGIKQREIWRPLAPSVLDEHFGEYFEGNFTSPFMNIACTVREEVRRRIPAVVHVDGTARPQVVVRAHAPDYWRLIDEFGKLTGVPVLLNTSFNLRGEPIVSSPKEAIRSYLASELDALVLENALVTKEAH